MLLLAILAMANTQRRYRIYNAVGSVSKWSMSGTSRSAQLTTHHNLSMAFSDVFAMGVFVSFLASSSHTNLKAQLEPGFFFFLAYCIVSLIALQVLLIEEPNEHSHAYSPVRTDDDEGLYHDDSGSASVSSSGATPIGRVTQDQDDSDEDPSSRV